MGQKYERGRIRNDGSVLIRQVGKIRIVFFDSESVYLSVDGDSKSFIFHRWFAPRGTYNDWKSFRSALRGSKHENIGWYFEEAAVWGIPSTMTTREIELEGKEVKIEKV